MTKILSIDPGPLVSAWVLSEDTRIISSGLEPNEFIVKALDYDEYEQDILALEYAVAYGRSGKSVSDTAFESGRMVQASKSSYAPITRSKVRGHFCGSRGSDAKVITALVERFTPDIFAKWVTGELTRNKMLMAAREKYFIGFKDDIWQAYAVGVAYYDLNLRGNDGGTTT